MTCDSRDLWRFSARAGDPKEAGVVHQKDCSTRGISWGFIGHRGPGLKHRDSPLCQLVIEMVPATSQVPAWEARTAVLVSRVSGTDVTVMLQGRSKRLASWTSCLMIISQENSKFPLRFQIETVKKNKQTIQNSQFGYAARVNSAPNPRAQ